MDASVPSARFSISGEMKRRAKKGKTRSYWNDKDEDKGKGISHKQKYFVFGLSVQDSQILAS